MNRRIKQWVWLAGISCVLACLAFVARDVMAACNAPDGTVYELTAQIAGPDQACPDQDTTFSVTANGSIAAYQWTAVGAVPSSGTTATFTTKWNSSGNKTVSVKIFGADPAINGACEATKQQNVKVPNKVSGSASSAFVLPTSGAEVSKGATVAHVSKGSVDFELCDTASSDMVSYGIKFSTTDGVSGTDESYQLLNATTPSFHKTYIAWGVSGIHAIEGNVTGTTEVYWRAGLGGVDGASATNRHDFVVK